MEKIKIRKARVKDIEEIRPLFVDFMNHHGRLDSVYTIVKNNKAHVIKYLRRLIYGRKSIFLVGEKDKKIISFMSAGLGKTPPIYRNREFGIVYDAYVVKNARRQGVNTEMLKMTFDWFREKKIKRIELGVLMRNEPAIRAWEAHGFKIISQRGRKILSR